MPLPALELLEKKLEKHKRQFELKKGAWERGIERRIQLFEQKKDEIERGIERRIQLFEQKKDALERRLEQHFDSQKRKFERKLEDQRKKLEGRLRRFEQKNGVRLDDEVRFLRTWMEKPLALGAVTPSGRALARTMASYIDPRRAGPVIELGPGTGPVTEALIAHGLDQRRLVLVEFDPAFCRLLQARYPAATIVQGDAYQLKRLLAGLLQQPAAGVVSGLPLFTKPPIRRMRLLFEAFSLMSPGAPFVQFTYNAVPPIPRRLDRVTTEASERIWMNIPPARVWVYRRDYA